jgi:hypothetical protein
MGSTSEEVWKALKTTSKLDDDSLQIIQQMYFDKMKPVVSEEQLVALRERYRVRRKK